LPRAKSYRIRLNDQELKVLERIMAYGAESISEAVRHVIHEYARLHDGIVIPSPEHYEAIMRAMARTVRGRRRAGRG